MPRSWMAHSTRFALREAVFKIKLHCFFWILSSCTCVFLIVEINIFWGGLTNVSAIKASLFAVSNCCLYELLE